MSHTVWITCKHSFWWFNPDHHIAWYPYTSSQSASTCKYRRSRIEAPQWPKVNSLYAFFAFIAFFFFFGAASSSCLAAFFIAFIAFFAILLNAGGDLIKLQCNCHLRAL